MVALAIAGVGLALSAFSSYKGAGESKKQARFQNEQSKLAAASREKENDILKKAEQLKLANARRANTRAKLSRLATAQANTVNRGAGLDSSASRRAQGSISSEFAFNEATLTTGRVLADELRDEGLVGANIAGVSSSSAAASQAKQAQFAALGTIGNKLFLNSQTLASTGKDLGGLFKGGGGTFSGGGATGGY